MLRAEGLYHCTDETHVGLALSPDEAARLAAEATRRGMDVGLHPRTFLLESRRRAAVVLEWHLPHESCPFYADFKCTAYDLRPLVCRAYPVMLGAPAWSLAPECPKIPGPRAKVALGSLFRGEARARGAIERGHAALDARAQALLAAPGARWARGLTAREAERKARAWRRVTPEEAASWSPRKSA